MPINGDLLGYQRRSLPIGEIRMGYSVAVPGKTYRKPMRSDTWRFTTGSEQAALVAAGKFNGTMAPWERRKGRWEVVTDRTAIDVWVPPRGEAVDSDMEMWDGPRRKRACDGVTMSFPEPGRPCMCPLPGDPSDPRQVRAARDERERLAGLRPPQACRVLTRMALTIPDLPGMLGIWRLNTGSVNCAVESADSGEAMAIAREGGVYLPAVLRIEWRPRALDGSLAQVPVLMLGQSMRELAEHALPAGPNGLLRQLRGDAQPKAIEAPSQNVPRPGPVAEQLPAANGGRPGPGHSDQELADDERRYQIAQGIADECAGSITSARFTERWAEAREKGVEEEFVYTTGDRVSGPCLPLGEFLTVKWNEKGGRQ